MRSIGRKRRDEDEEESVFVPMTDMTVSFLFIVMILLAFFAVQFTDEDNVPRSVYEEVVSERNGLIDEVKRLNLEIDKLETFIKKLELENSNLINQNTKLAAENYRLDREINFAKRRISELEKEKKNSDIKMNLTYFQRDSKFEDYVNISFAIPLSIYGSEDIKAKKAKFKEIELNHKLETTLEIVMEHFVEMEERMEDLEADIEALQDAP